LPLLVFYADGTRMLSGFSPGPMHLWDLSSGKVLWASGQGGRHRAVFSPDGKSIAVAPEDGPITVFDAATGLEQRRLLGPKGPLAGMTFSPDGLTLTTCHTDGTLRVWQAATGKVLTQRKAAIGWEVNFSPDGRWFAGADNTNIVRLFETATGKEVHRLNHDSLAIHAVFAPDGRRLLTASRANAYLWALRPNMTGAPDAARLWADLAGADAAKAYRAIWACADRPELVCRMLADKIGGPVVLDIQQVRQWIHLLDSSVFAERDKATRELSARGRSVEPWLQQARAGSTSLETRLRVERLLQHIPQEPTAEEVAQQRALQALELMNNADARAAFRAWAKGAPGARLTEDAKAALARLGRSTEK
jgi:hypothetical protein